MYPTYYEFQPGLLFSDLATKPVPMTIHYIQTCVKQSHVQSKLSLSLSLSFSLERKVNRRLLFH